jgi:hypothetical protein
MREERTVIVISTNIETGRKYLEVVECITCPKEEIVQRVNMYDCKHYNNRTWRVIENVDPDLVLVLLQKAEAEKEEKRQKRENIREYFRAAENAIEELETIWNEKY